MNCVFLEADMQLGVCYSDRRLLRACWDVLNGTFCPVQEATMTVKVTSEYGVKSVKHRTWEQAHTRTHTARSVHWL